MNVPVAAKSLSALINLAANPPQYPRNPTHETLEPLVLYIVRVPGSKDVFLSPLRPPTKASISAEAILSSLYYFHVSGPGDDNAPTTEDKNSETRQEVDSKLSGLSIRRKPLPSEPNVSKTETSKPISNLEDYVEQQQEQSLKEDRNFPDPARGAGDDRTTASADIDAATASILPRKPVGPRPLPQTTHSAAANRDLKASGLDKHGDASLGTAPDNRPTDHATSGIINHPRPGIPTEPADGMLGASAADSRRDKGTCISIIRRDPSSTSQWNVGNIILKAFSGVLGSDDIKIEISTPGYQRFTRTGSYKSDVRKAELASLLSRRQDSSMSTESHPSFSPTKIADMAPPSQEPEEPMPTMFTRCISLTASRSKSPKKHGPGRIRTLSDPLRALDPNVIAPALSKAAQLRRANPSFLSPWEGMCTFATGMDGRSLKCKHTLASSSLENGPTSVTAAELRFNLPWTGVLNQKKEELGFHGRERGNSGGQTQRPSLGAIFDKIGDGKHASTLRNSFQRIKDHSLNREPSDQAFVTQPSKSPAHEIPSREGHGNQPGPTADERLDLTLGREKAGGGMRGSSAKLGKLVIEDEGLKMCDLVVASCMAVWWMYYQHD
ncbi:MAG: hypothetical protein Q9227_006829 [Pyrenula ochraceoflavens]